MSTALRVLVWANLTLVFLIFSTLTLEILARKYIYTRGKNPGRFAVSYSYDYPELDHPWWRVKVQVGWHWWSWENTLRSDIRGIREKVVERGQG